VHDDLFRPDFGGSRCRGEGGFAALRRDPDLDLVGGYVRRAVLRLHRRMGEERRAVLGLDALGCRGERCIDIAVLADHRRLRRGEPATQELGDAGARHLAVLPLVPGYRQRIDRLLRLPPAVGDNGDRVGQRHDLANAFEATNFGLVE
jgi:hypothetical protein